MTKLPTPPEPCLSEPGDRCRSPSACSDFGYCRERGLNNTPSANVAYGWKIIAQRRRREAIQQGLWPYLRDR